MVLALGYFNREKWAAVARPVSDAAAVAAELEAFAAPDQPHYALHVSCRVTVRLPTIGTTADL